MRRHLPITFVLFLAILATIFVSLVQAAELRSGLVVQDTALRGAPKDTAPASAQLWRGELLELRAERGDHVQVWDYRRERGGWVRKSQVLILPQGEGAATELAQQLRLVRQQWGTEGLGLGLAAAYIQAATPAQLASREGAEVLDAMGALAERIADRASQLPTGNKPAENLLAAQLEVAARYGVRFTQIEAEEGRVQVCYEGEAFRRSVALASSTPEARARAALALTRPECLDPRATPRELEARDQWRAQVLAQVDLTGLAQPWKNRVLMRRASVAASLAFAAARRGEGTAEPALADFASVTPAELTDDDSPAYSEAAMRVNAARWIGRKPGAELGLKLSDGQPGETCVTLGTAKRCTYGLVQLASASRSPNGRSLTLAVQPLDGWRELWVFRRTGEVWSVDVLPPAPAAPGLGVAEFAGWVPGGQQMLVAREFRAEGRYRRSFEVVSLSTLATERQSGEPKALGVFQRWADAGWVSGSPVGR